MEPLVRAINELIEKGSVEHGLTIFKDPILVYDKTINIKTVLYNSLTDEFKAKLTECLIYNKDIENVIISSCCQKLSKFLETLNSKDEFILLNNEFEKPNCELLYYKSCIECPMLKLFTIINRTKYVISLEEDTNTMTLLKVLKYFGKLIHINKSSDFINLEEY